MTKTLLALSSVALAAALVGCGDGSNGSPSASPTADALDQGVKFAQCMRKNGIQMEDPKPGEAVRMLSKSGNEAKMRAAQKACKAYAPTMKGDGKESAEDLDRMTKLAQCLRKHGLDVKDPKPGEPFSIRTRKGNEQKSNEAMKACNSEAGMPVPGAGGGSGSLNQKDG